MATFEELVAALRSPGEDGVDPTIYDDITALYTGDVGTRDSKLAEMETLVGDLQAKNTQLIEHNYELLKQLGNTNDEVNVEGADVANDDAEDNEEGGVASLFTTDKDND